MRFSLTPNALALAAGTQTTTVTVTCTSTACAGKTQTVAVSLVVSSPPAQLGVSNSLLAFTSSTTPPSAQSQPLGIQNQGGGILTITSITCQAPWCFVGTIPATITGCLASTTFTHQRQLFLPISDNYNLDDLLVI
jgi:hypothetical protein